MLGLCAAVVGLAIGLEKGGVVSELGGLLTVFIGGPILMACVLVPLWKLGAWSVTAAPSASKTRAGRYDYALVILAPSIFLASIGAFIISASRMIEPMRQDQRVKLEAGYRKAKGGSIPAEAANTIVAAAARAKLSQDEFDRSQKRELLSLGIGINATVVWLLVTGCFAYKRSKAPQGDSVSENRSP
jgi:hypothetical protein